MYALLYMRISANIYRSNDIQACLRDIVGLVPKSWQTEEVRPTVAPFVLL